jgi:hypothetical protein
MQNSQLSFNTPDSDIKKLKVLLLVIACFISPAFGGPVLRILADIRFAQAQGYLKAPSPMSEGSRWESGAGRQIGKPMDGSRIESTTSIPEKTTFLELLANPEFRQETFKTLREQAPTFANGFVQDFLRSEIESDRLYWSSGFTHEQVKCSLKKEFALSAEEKLHEQSAVKEIGVEIVRTAYDKVPQSEFTTRSEVVRGMTEVLPVVCNEHEPRKGEIVEYSAKTEDLEFRFPSPSQPLELATINLTPSFRSYQSVVAQTIVLEPER